MATLSSDRRLARLVIWWEPMCFMRVIAVAHATQPATRDRLRCHSWLPRHHRNHNDRRRECVSRVNGNGVPQHQINVAISARYDVRAILRWTKSDPGARPVMTFGGTRESAQPIHKKSGFCSSASSVRCSGWFARVSALHWRLPSQLAVPVMRSPSGAPCSVRFLTYRCLFHVCTAVYGGCPKASGL